MFCFPNAGRHRSRKIETKSSLTADFSKSVSVLNHYTNPILSTSNSIICHSDSNIPMIGLTKLRPSDISFLDEILPDTPDRKTAKRPPKLQLNLMDFLTQSESSSSGNLLAASAPIASPERTSPVESSISSEENSVFKYGSEPSSPAPRTRYKLIHQGDVQVCVLNHTRTIVSKVLSSQFLRRWELHHIYLQDNHISSKSNSGFMEHPVPYSNIQDVYVVARWDHGKKYCIRLTIPNGSILFQASSSFIRDQWLHSVIWKRNIYKYRCILKKSSRPEVILKEIKNLVEFTLSSPVQDESLINVPIAIISNLLDMNELWCIRERREELISYLSSLLEDTSPSTEICQFFSEHCKLHPRSNVIATVFTPVVHRILKRNVDFGKSPSMRRFVADYLIAVHSKNNGDSAIDNFVKSVHGAGCICPHPRVLPNLVAVCVSAILQYYEKQRSDKQNDIECVSLSEHQPQLDCCISLFTAISNFEDWREGLSQLLQPVPFPEECAFDTIFLEGFSPVIHHIGTDPRCHVHSMILPVRPGKECWLSLYCPSSGGCVDGGILWCDMLQMLLQCCCRRKSFLRTLLKQLGALLLSSLRQHDVAHQVLCLILEWRLANTHEQELQIMTTLQSTEDGRERYKELCKRQDYIRELQCKKKKGPRRVTVPGRATDSDVALLLSCSSGNTFGNLEWLSLAFTMVTSACAQHLIALPSLKYLNLWATHFGDAGLILIADHLDQLQVLNLCETPVTDHGITAILGLTSLKKLNLNSTKLSLVMFEKLRKELPNLQELDVRYTDAW